MKHVTPEFTPPPRNSRTQQKVNSQLSVAKSDRFPSSKTVEKQRLLSTSVPQSANLLALDVKQNDLNMLPPLPEQRIFSIF